MSVLVPLLAVLFMIYFCALSESILLYLLARFSFSYSYILTWLTVPIYVFFVFRFEYVSQKIKVIRQESAQIRVMSLYFAEEEALKMILEKNAEFIRLTAIIYAVVATLFFLTVFLWESLQKFLLFFI